MLLLACVTFRIAGQSLLLCLANFSHKLHKLVIAFQVDCMY